MNDTTLRELDAAYLAGLLDNGRASIYVTLSGGRHRLNVKVFPPEHLQKTVSEWVEGTDFKPLISSPWLWWQDESVGTLITMAWPYLKSPVRRQQAELVFRFYRTRAKPGLHIGPEGLAERDAVRTELQRLREVG